ncbi:protein yciI [Fimicolochytrium jonesii]|uniref:protein yciI n=1 Tax=Fimicolochytrium jonesii TaxID=1396493 RepID=UPI0022FF2C6B|nr:protein yciI [Fimicolochytrium jonesii]KAI8820651.1 protein yciI [Fimicolochytrium jonesii]
MSIATRLPYAANNVVRSSYRFSLSAAQTRYLSATAFVGKPYVVVAHDATDSGALQRRLDVRPAHFEKVAAAKAEGKIVLGGAILDSPNEEKMVGSVLVVDMESKEAVEEFVRADVYVKNNVWKSWEIFPFKPAKL